jgi:hypothetical protein
LIESIMVLLHGEGQMASADGAVDFVAGRGGPNALVFAFVIVTSATRRFGHSALTRAPRRRLNSS